MSASDIGSRPGTLPFRARNRRERVTGGSLPFLLIFPPVQKGWRGSLRRSLRHCKGSFVRYEPLWMSPLESTPVGVALTGV